MITIFLTVVGILLFGFLILNKIAPVVTKTASGFKLNYPVLFSILIWIVVILFQPYGIEKIDAGHSGIKVNLIGDNRGASKIEYVSGYVLYNTYTEEIHEIPIDQKHIDYPAIAIIAKGGFPCSIKPSFNYAVNPVNTSEMFTNLRGTYRTGGLAAVEDSWLKNGILGAMNDVANKYGIDDIFNNREAFENQVVIEINKRVGKWFTISQFRSNITPPESIRKSIEEKAAAIQEAVTSKAQAEAATAQGFRKVALAKADSAALVIKASAEAEVVRLKDRALTPLYVDWVKAANWNGVLPTTVLGNSTPMLNIK